MQQAAPLQVVGLAEVEHPGCLGGVGRQPEALLLPLQVVDERDGRRFVGDAAERLADDQLAADQPHGHVVAEAEDRPRRLVQLLQARQVPVAQRRQGLGQADRLDRRGRRGIQPLIAQQPGHAGHPALGDVIARCPQMMVPARRLDTRAVSALIPEPAVRPGDPGRGDLRLRQALQQGIIFLCGWPAILRQGRRVPGAADDGDPAVSFGLRGPDGPPHVRLAALFSRVLDWRDAVADLGHRLEDRGEQVGSVAAVLDDVLPPALALAEPGRLGEHLERVDAQADGQLRRVIFPVAVRLRSRRLLGPGRLLRLEAELVPHRQVHEPDGNALCEREADRLPLWREEGERVIHRLLRVLGPVDQQGDRRLHALAAASSIRASASGGPSMSTASGSSAASAAPRLRDEPGP